MGNEKAVLLTYIIEISSPETRMFGNLGNIGPI
jgi:hypothetical protein